ncbi:uncharacterized protein G2W53_042121 [Senna tora]|uniref:Uncharacterized protein n=1 Tax=Senna tora TaxID=362788 RepID=A0A834SI83_9FABA|nr:uncharacterized protein G2W53_042121 [Senna tora]
MEGVEDDEEPRYSALLNRNLKQKDRIDVTSSKFKEKSKCRNLNSQYNGNKPRILKCKEENRRKRELKKLTK